MTTLTIIQHLDKEQTRKMRRQMLSDTVYILFHDTLKQWSREDKTTLSPQEIFLAATRWSKMLLSLPDAEEGLADEMDDLEDEAEAETDAMLIMMTAACIIQAMAKAKTPPPCEVSPIIQQILKRWHHHELYYPLLDGACRKEQDRWVENKRNHLLEYELMEIDMEDEKNIEEGLRRLIDDLRGSAWDRCPNVITDNLLELCKLNIQGYHQLDKPILEIFDKFSGKADINVGGDNHGMLAARDINVKAGFTNEQTETIGRLIASQSHHIGIEKDNSNYLKKENN